MKVAFIFILVGFIVTNFDLSAQENPNYQKFWVKNYSQAIDSLNKTGKPLLILFSGSDWCKPCIKLRTNIIETEPFMNYAKSHLILINADFPYHKKIDANVEKQNEQLAEKYNKEGAFPKIVIIDRNQKVLFEEGYSDITPEIFIKELEAKLVQ